jgi:transcriptional regulator with XRE-family HTH domain
MKQNFRESMQLFNDKKKRVVDINYAKMKKEILFSNNKENSFIQSLAMRLSILRQMTNLSLEEYCEKYRLDPKKYREYESGESLISHSESVLLITKMFLANEIYCRTDWLEKGEKNPPMYISNEEKKIKDIDISHRSVYGSMLELAYSYKNSNPKNIISVVCDSFMDSFLKKGTIVSGPLVDLNNIKEVEAIQECLCIIEGRGKQLVRVVSYHNNYLCCSTLDPVRQNLFALKEVESLAYVKFIMNRDILLTDNSEDL